MMVGPSFSVYANDGGNSTECKCCANTLPQGVTTQVFDEADANQHVAHALAEQDVTQLVVRLQKEGLRPAVNKATATKIMENSVDVGSSVVIPFFEAGNDPDKLGLIFNVNGPEGTRTWALVFDKSGISNAFLVTDGEVHSLTDSQGDVQAQLTLDQLLCVLICGEEATSGFCGVACATCLAFINPLNPGCVACVGCIVGYSVYCYYSCF